MPYGTNNPRNLRIRPFCFQWLERFLTFILCVLMFYRAVKPRFIKSLVRFYLCFNVRPLYPCPVPPAQWNVYLVKCSRHLYSTGMLSLSFPAICVLLQQVRYLFFYARPPNPPNNLQKI